MSVAETGVGEVNSACELGCRRRYNQDYHVCLPRSVGVGWVKVLMGNFSSFATIEVRPNDTRWTGILKTN